MTVLLCAQNMVEVPDLLQNSAIIITAKPRVHTSLRVKGICDLCAGVCRCIGGNNSGSSEYIVSRIHLENLYDSLEEVDNFLVFLVSGLVASNVECGCASSMY